MIVVADTSVLLNLCCVAQAELLRGLFREIVIPPEVAQEFGRLARDVSRFKGQTLPVWVRQQAATDVPDAVRKEPGLDCGESAALALAIEIGADAILIDESRAYEVATGLGLKTIGLLGILIQAKSSGLIGELRPILDRLTQDAGFWLSADLRNQVLRLAGE